MLRQLAQQAREERISFMSGTKPSKEDEDKEEEEAFQKRRKNEGEEEEEDEEELEARKERDRIRETRRRERERELRLQRNKSTLVRNADRDITEKIALGIAMPQASSEVAYDQRLFNQSQGMDSGFGDDESYNIYTKPLFQGSSANQIYRPKPSDESETYGSEKDYQKLLDTSKFKPDKGFSGTTSESQEGKFPRSGPLQFERDGPSEQDPFGIDEFLSQAKTSASQKKPLDKIGQTGALHAASTSSGSAYQSSGSKRSRIDFESSKSSSSSKDRYSSSSRDRHSERSPKKSRH